MSAFLRVLLSLSLVTVMPYGSEAQQRRPASAQKKASQTKTLSLEGLTAKDKAEMLRLQRAAFVRMERVQNRRVKMETKRATFSFQLFSSARAVDTNHTNNQNLELLRKLQKQAKLIRDLERTAQDSREFLEAKVLYESHRRKLAAEGISAPKYLPPSAESRDKIWSDSKTFSEFDQYLNEMITSFSEQIPEQTERARSRAGDAASPPNLLLEKTCSFAGEPSTFITAGNQTVCQHPQQLKQGCSPGTSKCGATFTFGHDEPDRCVTPQGGMKNISEACAKQFPPLKAEEIENLSAEQAKEFDNTLLAGLPAIEKQLMTDCGRDITGPAVSKNECPARVAQYAALAEIAQINEANKPLIGVSKDLQEYLPVSDRYPETSSVRKTEGYQGISADPALAAISDTINLRDIEALAAEKVKTQAEEEGRKKDYKAAERARMMKDQADSCKEHTLDKPLTVLPAKLELACIKNCDGDNVYAVIERFKKSGNNKGNIKEIRYIHSPDLSFKEFATSVKELEKNKTKLAAFRKKYKNDNFAGNERTNNLGRCEFKDNPKSKVYFDRISDGIETGLMCKGATEDNPDEKYKIVYNAKPARKGLNGINSDNMAADIKKKKQFKKTTCDSGKLLETLRFNRNSGKDNDELEYIIEKDSPGFLNKIDGSYFTKCNFPAIEKGQTELQKNFAKGVMGSLSQDICGTDGAAPGTAQPNSVPALGEETAKEE